MSCGITTYPEFRKANIDYSRLPPRAPRGSPDNEPRKQAQVDEERRVAALWRGHQVLWP